MKKFTFKTIKPTGKWKSFDEDVILIKLNKKECGSIDATHPHKIRLMVVKDDINEDGNTNCIWKWISFKNEFKTINDAKSFLNKYYIVNYPPTQSDGMGFKPDNECKEQYIVDFSAEFTVCPSKEITLEAL